MNDDLWQARFLFDKAVENLLTALRKSGKGESEASRISEDAYHFAASEGLKGEAERYERAAYLIDETTAGIWQRVVRSSASEDEQPLTLSVPEAAALTGIGRNAFYRAVKDGTIPSLRIGRTIRISRKRLVAWLNGEVEK